MNRLFNPKQEAIMGFKIKKERILSSLKKLVKDIDLEELFKPTSIVDELPDLDSMSLDDIELELAIIDKRRKALLEQRKDVLQVIKERYEL